jgi:hypothetical protein
MRRKLGTRHFDIIVALLDTRSTAKAAARAGVSERTIYRLFKRPEFRQAFDDARMVFLTESLAVLGRQKARELAGAGR